MPYKMPDIDQPQYNYLDAEHPNYAVIYKAALLHVFNIS